MKYILSIFLSDCCKSTVCLSYLVGMEMQIDMSKNYFKADQMH